MKSNVPIADKLIPIDVQVSTEVTEVNGTAYRLVKHTSSEYRYLAGASAIATLRANGDLTEAMDGLEDSLSPDWEEEA